jgi:hypothetical protein
LGSDWYDAEEPIWYDEIAANKVRYKHQVAVELLELGSANYKSLVHSLSFVKNKKQISVYLQSMGGGPANHGRPISDDDLAVILAELERNPSPSEEVPHVEEGHGTFVEKPGVGSGLLRPTAAVLPWLFQDLESVARGSVNREKYVEGRDPSTIFEDLVFLAFRFLGYNTSRQLGYTRGAGRPGPDGEARSSNADYVVVYDVKQRGDGYALSAADYRALREYVEAAQGRGDANVFCVVVSSSFSGEPRSVNGVPLTFISASALLELVALKVQNPDVVNSRTLRKLFGTTGILTHQNIEQWASDHDADRLDMSHLLKLTSERVG